MVEGLKTEVEEMKDLSCEVYRETLIAIVWTIIILVLCTISVLVYRSSEIDWKQEAIQHNVGYYDAHTGEFRWRQFANTPEAQDTQDAPLYNDINNSKTLKGDTDVSR